MATEEINKPKVGFVCAVSTCANHSAKSKNERRTDILFHRFPNDLSYRKQWIQKCKRADKWIPRLSFICSDHFNNDDYIRNLPAELLSCTPKGRRLKPDAIPTLNLPGHFIQGDEVSTSTKNLNKRMETKAVKQAHEEIITLAPNPEIPSVLNQLPTMSIDESRDYKTLYYDLLKDHNKLKTDLSMQENKLISAKNSNESFIKINKSLQSGLKQLQTNIYNLNIQIKENEMSPSNLIKQLSGNKTRTIEILAKKYLSSVFSQNQLDLMMNKKKIVHWSRDEIFKAFTLKYFSERAYIYVNNELKYPLPGIKSLQRWVNTIDLKNGVLGDVLEIMRLNGESMESSEKLTVLMFGEVKVASTLEYDVADYEVVGPHSQMQVIMARGIGSNWKQQIYVHFDQEMTKEILFEVIEILDQIGFKTVCCVSDCGGSNISLWKALDVNYENPVFSIPNGREIVYMPDVPHILKLLRNELLDTGFVIGDQYVNKKPFEILISKTSTELNINHKLSLQHLTCAGPQRQQVCLASQLLSHTTATALLHYKTIDDNKLLEDTSNFVELINNWFNLMNVSHLNDRSTPFTTPYGLALKEQDLLLDKVYATILTMRCIGKVELQIFQKAMLMQINGTKVLLKILQQNGLKYLLTCKTNQNALENLFSRIHGSGGLDDHPTPLNALHRLRMMISNQTNTSHVNDEEFMVVSVLKKMNLKINNLENLDGGGIGSSAEGDMEFLQEINKCEMEKDAVEYLAGWVAKKYKFQFPELGSTKTQCNLELTQIPTWIHHLSCGGLIVPSRDFKNQVFRIEWLFKKLTRNQIPKRRLEFVSELTDKIFRQMVIDIRYKPVIYTYIQQRVSIRMIYLNQHSNLLKKKNKSKSTITNIAEI